ncbi:MAG: DUF3006 domain-containing protein [Deltaproteobacteria bacterium]|nr:DUF3006 domain-containing protein [Deltaproteobacteria bacterium]
MITAFYAVDRLEGKIAVLVADDGTTVEVDRSRVPARVREGTVLRVPVAGSEPDWAGAEIDQNEQQRRMKQMRWTLDEMKRTDPGGGIEL